MEELKWTSAGAFKSKESARSKVDLTYLDKYGNSSVYEIPTSFEKYNFKENDTFSMRISNIYDPSKFWIVHRYRELEAFQVHLFRFYYKHKSNYQIPREKIEVGLYCIAFTDGGYYRGVVVSCPVSHSHEIEKVKIFFFDYGLIQLISPEHVFYLGEVQSLVPKFAIRACLTGIVPYESPTWTAENVETFLNLVQNKDLLALVDTVDEKRQLLVLHITTNDNQVSIADTLVQSGDAQYYSKGDVSNSKLKVKHLYAFPTHSSLEKGKYPFSVKVAETISKIVSPIKLYPKYYAS